jgi:MoaA/NifB/PqqE/SkfB family radical SAM enzyme
MAIIYVDLIDACHMRCPTCVRGTRILPNTSRRIPIELFERIVRKAKTEGYDSVGLYNWTEPFLNPQIPRYIRIVKALNLACDVSSTLSFSGRLPLIEQALRAGLDTLIVSVSGYTQETHQINHRGGILSLVKENLEHISRMLTTEEIKTKVVLRFLKFAHNLSEEALVEDYARRLGLAFETLEGIGMVDNPVSNYAHAEAFQTRLQNYTPSRPYERDGEVCPIIMDTVAVDANGTVSLCCANPNFPFLSIGQYQEMTQSEILLGRYTHPICPSCSIPRRAVTHHDRRQLSGALAARLRTPGETKTSDAIKQSLYILITGAKRSLYILVSRTKQRLKSWLGMAQRLNPLH